MARSWNSSGADVDAAQQQDLDQRADEADNDRARDNPAPKAERAAYRRRQRDGDVGAQHVERAVRDVDDARDAKDKGKPGRDEEQTRRRGQAVEGLKRKAFPVHRVVPRHRSIRRSGPQLLHLGIRGQHAGTIDIFVINHGAAAVLERELADKGAERRLMVDGAKTNGPNGPSTLRPAKASTSFSVSVEPALAMPAASDLIIK